MNEIERADLLELAHRAMRDEGLTADEAIERYDAEEIRAQIRAIAEPLAFRRSVPSINGRRKAAFMHSVRRPQSRGLAGWVFGTPARAAAPP
ncbi:MAG: hypothetical protein WEB00_16130, partial [Dehalococcoidia bacterium]